MNKVQHSVIFQAYLQRMPRKEVISLVKLVHEHQNACLDPVRGNPDKALRKMNKKLKIVMDGVHQMDLRVMDEIIGKLQGHYENDQ